MQQSCSCNLIIWEVSWAGSAERNAVSQIWQADFSVNSKRWAFPVGLQEKTSLSKRLGLVHIAQVCNKLMTRSVLNAQSVVSWHGTKTESRAQYCLFVMVSFIISHCKRNFPLDPYQCLRNFFFLQAPWAVVQSKAHGLQFRCCSRCMSPNALSLCICYGELPWFPPDALVETQPRHGEVTYGPVVEETPPGAHTAESPAV